MSRLFRTAKSAAKEIARRLTGRPPSSEGGTGRRTAGRRTADRGAPVAPTNSLARRLARLIFGRGRTGETAPPDIVPPVSQEWLDYQRQISGGIRVPPVIEPGEEDEPVPFPFPPLPTQRPEPPSVPVPPAIPQPPTPPAGPRPPAPPSEPPQGPPPGSPPPPTGQPPEMEEPPEDRGGRGAPYRLEDWQRVMLEMRLTPGSSNVYGYYFELESRTRGILYVTFLGVLGDGRRSGAGQTYAYYDVPARKFHEFRQMSEQTAGGAVWDYLRIRGTVSGHQHTYRLIHSHGPYVPRKATPEGFRTRAVTSTGTGRRGYRRSTLPERRFATPERRRKPGEPGRGEPNRGEPDRGT